MTRKELLQLLVLQARGNGFEFRRWYQSKIGDEWTTADAAVETLSQGGRYYALLFSHQFARYFWRPGRQMQFVVPRLEFTRLNARGEEITVVRKAYTRRTMRGNAWEYHLREMAASEQPLGYIRRFLITVDGGVSPEAKAELELEADLEADLPAGTD